MQSETLERQRWRRTFIATFATDFGLDVEVLAPSTRTWLEEWARQSKIVEDQPSSNFQDVILQLCKAVESELAAGLGNTETLSFLKGGTLAQKAAGLRKVRLDVKAAQEIEHRGIKSDFIVGELPGLLSGLSTLRWETGAAHGNAQIGSATLEDANRARGLAGQILQAIASNASK